MNTCFCPSITLSGDDAFFNWNWVGACWGRWAGPGLILGWSAGSWTVGAKEECYNVDQPTLDVALLYINKEEGGSAGASPVAAPMPKSVSL